MIQDYISYLTKTLGIKQVILPEIQVAPTLPRILFIDEKPWSKDATALFTKMQEAMKLNHEQVDIVFESETTLPDLQVKALTHDVIVFFTDKNFEKIEANKKFMTSGPEQMLKQPQLKKEAWAVLQNVMAAIS
jgi:hypothetical protein